MSENFLAEEAAVPQAPKSKPLKLPFPRDCPIELDANPELAPPRALLPPPPRPLPTRAASLPKHSVLKFLSGRQHLARTAKE